MTSCPHELHWKRKTGVRKKNISDLKNIYFKPVCAAGDRGEDVVAVHGAEYQLRSVPDLAAVGVPALEPGAPTLQTSHTHGREVTNTTFRLHLNKIFFNFLLMNY